MNKNLLKIFNWFVLGIMVIEFMVVPLKAHAQLITESGSYWHISSSKQELYEGPSATTITELSRHTTYTVIARETVTVRSRGRRGRNTVEYIDTVLASGVELQAYEAIAQEFAKTNTISSRGKITQNPDRTLVVSTQSDRKVLVTNQVVYYSARIETPLPVNDTCVSLEKQLIGTTDENAAAPIKQEMANNGCVIKINLYTITKTATREDSQIEVTGSGFGWGRQSSWQTTATGTVKTTEAVSSSLQTVYSPYELVKKIEESRTWQSDCGKGCTRSYFEYNGAYLIANGCTFSAHNYQEQEAGKGGKNVIKVIGMFSLGFILNVILPGSGMILGAWTIGDTLGVAALTGLISTGSTFNVASGGTGTLVWCPGPGEETLAWAKPEVSVSYQDCHNVTLSVKDTSGKIQTYNVLRDEATVADNIPISQTEYKDGNLDPHTKYQYKVIGGPLPGEAIADAYTKCLPSCTFGADKNQIVFPVQAALSWNCLYADSCGISPTVGSVNAQSGTVKVSPTSTTDYILACQNSDGSISYSSSIDVVIPKIKEVKP